jgi:predicted metalloprotease
VNKKLAFMSSYADTAAGPVRVGDGGRKEILPLDVSGGHSATGSLILFLQVAIDSEHGVVRNFERCSRRSRGRRRRASSRRLM